MESVKDPSGSDQLFTGIRLEAECLMNIALLPSTFADEDAEIGAGGLLKKVRHYLTQPRRELYYDLESNGGTVGPNPVIQVPSTGSRGRNQVARDDANGPYPDDKAIEVSYTTADTLLIKFAVTTYLTDCNSPNRTIPLSLRWADTISFDETFRATYERSGTCIISSLSIFTMDTARRNFISPRIPLGFTRVASSYEISSDGLRCNFHFMDKQIRWAPPYPAIDMSIVQSETTAPTGQGIRHGAIRVTIKGAINAHPIDLQRLCARVGNTRVIAAHGTEFLKGTVLGQIEFETNESPAGVEAVYTVSYKIPVNAGRQLMATGNVPWGALLGPAAVQAVGGADNPVNRQAVPIAASTINYDWVGFGTSTGNPTVPNSSYATWANQSTSIAAPCDGLTLGTQVKLFASLLRDPCGEALEVTPNAFPTTATIRTSVPYFNTAEGGGHGGPTAVDVAQLAVTLSSLTASQMATTTAVTDTQGAYIYAPGGYTGVYTVWQSQNEYVDDGGNVVVPSCNPDGKSVAIQHSNQQTVLRRKWVAERLDSPPQLPPKSSGSNFVMTNSFAGVRDMRINPGDGVTQIYRAEGVYEFACLDPNLVTENADVAPFLNAAVIGGSTGWINSPNVNQPDPLA